jgi:hypothetical protein
MQKLARGFLSAVAILLSLVVLRAYWRHQGAADAKLEQEDATHQRTIDSLRVRVAYAESMEAVRLDQIARLDSQIRKSRSRRAPIEARVDSARVRADTAALVAGLDSVVVALKEENRQLTLQVTLWQAMYVSADSGRRLIHDALHESEALREAWKGRARRRLACVGGPSVTVSLGGRSAVGVGITCGWRF